MGMEIAKRNKRQFSIIVWGATGFTGKLVCEYLATKSSASFAISGRSLSKLNQIESELLLLAGKERFPTGKIEKILADSGDYQSLEAMVSKASVVITTVGPYAKYGELLVKACVQNGTDYVDLTGEPNFVKNIVEKYHQLAVEKNVLIVNSCGFDCIPSDLGTLLITDYFKQKQKQTKGVRLSLVGGKGGASGGTLASMCYMLENLSFLELRQMSGNPDYLVPTAKKGTKYWGSTILHYDKDFKTWQAPSVMETVNRAIIRRSNGFLSYGQEFQYCEGTALSNVVFATIVTILFATIGVILLFPPSRWILQKIVPPGTGPSESTRKAGFFHLSLVGESEDGEKVFAEVKAEGDPGYQATSMMITESALCLAFDKAKLCQPTSGFQTIRGGVVTPAVAMGMVLVERLRRAGMTFDLNPVTT